MKYIALIAGLLITIQSLALSKTNHSLIDTSGNQNVLLDIDGKPVNAHGAGVLFYKGVYYLFGEVKNGKTWLVPGQSWEDYRVPAGGISCYSSKDLKHWKNHGVVLKPTVNVKDSDLDTGRVIERPKVIYNEHTRKFVMWMHIDKNDYNYSRGGLAISDSPTGPYHYLGSVQPNGQMLRDMTLYKDDDGKAYLIYSSEGNNTMHICLLSKDYLRPTKTYSRIFVGKLRESPAIFKHGRKYYLITSGCTGWSPNVASYAMADNILGPWAEYGNPCRGPHAEETFFAQGAFVLPVNNKPGNFIFMTDQWNKLDLASSTYLWLPFQVVDKKISIYNLP